MNYLLIGFVVLVSTLIGVVVYLHYRKSAEVERKTVCQKDTDCRSGERCIVDTDNPKANVCAEAHMKNCTYTDYTKLSACDPNNPESCKDCINQPAFACVVVDYGSPVITNRGRGYASGQTSAVLYDTATNTKDLNRSMKINVTVTDTANGYVDKILILDPLEVFKKDDVFAILGGNNDATFRLTTAPKPFFWQKAGKRVTLPESPTGQGWCLPPVKTTDIQCNPYTSDTILVQDVDADGKMSYSWGCYCKLPSFMQHRDSPNSNCSKLVGCGGYDLYIPPKPNEGVQCTSNANCVAPNTKCCNESKCLQSAADTFPSAFPGQCHTRWGSGDTETNRPAVNGTCDCPPNMNYLNAKIGDYVVKTCNADPCVPGGTKTSAQLCTCNPGFVSCGITPGPNVNVTDSRCSSSGGVQNRCVPDPCASGGTMRQGGGCNCRLVDGFVETKDVSVVGGSVCTKLCVNNGPCGNRGTCVIEKNEEKCKDCVCPWVQSSDGLCSTNSGKQPTEGAACQFTSSSSYDWVTGKIVETRTPVADSCCAPLVCRGSDARCRR